MKYCAEYAALLDLYVDGELPAEEMAQVQAHLDECPECRAYVDDALAMRAAFPEVENTAVPEHFCEDVMERVGRAAAAQKGKKVMSFRRWARVLAPLAACCALVIALKSVPGAGGGMGSSGAASSGSTADTAAPACGAALPGGEGPSADADAGVEAEGETALDWAPAEDAPEKAEEGYVLMDGTAENEGEYPNAGRSAETSGGTGMPETGGAAELPEVPQPAAAPQAAPPLDQDGEPLAPENRMQALKLPPQAALTLTEEEAGDLLDSYPVEAEQDGVRWYRLTGEEYRALLEALELDGEPDENLEAFMLVEVREGT